MQVKLSKHKTEGLDQQRNVAGYHTPDKSDGKNSRPNFTRWIIRLDIVAGDEQCASVGNTDMKVDLTDFEYIT